MIVNNPTKNDITVTLNGTEYTVEATSSLANVPKELAIYWKTRLHTFLTLTEESADVTKVKSVKVSKEETEAVEEILNSEADEADETEEEVVVEEEVKEEVEEVV